MSEAVRLQIAACADAAKKVLGDAVSSIGKSPLTNSASTVGGMMEALGSASLLLEQLGPDRVHATRLAGLANLQAELKKIADGEVSAALVPKKVKGRGYSPRQLRFLNDCLRCADLLVAAGLSKGAADCLVVKWAKARAQKIGVAITADKALVHKRKDRKWGKRLKAARLKTQIDDFPLRVEILCLRQRLGSGV